MLAEELSMATHEPRASAPAADVVVVAQDPHSAEAREMLDALWAEIQQRYGFTFPNGILPEDFERPRSGFWVALAGGSPVGSVGIKPQRARECAELDGMYVAPAFRGTGIAQRLVDALEAHARQQGFTVVRLRAGPPQPEAARFYEKVGYRRVPCWHEDDTGWCFEKRL
jgi:GNAT superfamily N-acetyltransferase